MLLVLIVACEISFWVVLLLGLSVRYVLGRRLDAARDRILAGQPLADVAAEVGFTDQAHLTRRFRRFLGTTPGQFAGRGRLPA